VKHRVFLADDHTVVRDGLRQLIDSQPDLEVAGEGADGREVLSAPALATCHVLVLDLSLPRVDGTEVLRRLQQVHPGLPVLVLSMYPEDQFASRTLREGASAYLSKTASSELVLDTIRRLARREALPEKEAPRKAQPHEQLSPREFQVFFLLLRGRSVSEIAAELDVTVATVSTHLGRVREKLGVRTNTEVMQYGHRVGLVS
jgi:DNA-binding NarL/FixJ family response regulator